MMQGDGKGIAQRPEHRQGGGTDPAHPRIKKMAEIVAVADFTPAIWEPGDIVGAPPARWKAHSGPVTRDKWVSASITDDIPSMIAKTFDEAWNCRAAMPVPQPTSRTSGPGLAVTIRSTRAPG